MATTTNYSWTTPDDTALVKDGASAIRTLGSSIDTTVKALNPSTTLGDIVYRSSTANTNTRLGIGTSGQVLSVSGGVPAWTTPSGGSMTLISTTALTGASTITISSIPTTGYQDLRLVLINAVCTNDAAQIRCRPNNISTAENYSTQQTPVGIPTNYVGDDTLMYLHGAVDNVVVENLAVMHIYNYASLTRKLIQVQSVNVNSTTNTNFTYINNTILAKDTAAISSITLISTGGNFNGGNAYVYGVK